MKLRRLQEKDIDGILEWMQDDDINRFFRFDGNSQTHSTVTGFIQDSFDDTKRHYAVVNDSDEYLGTVSLKEIDRINDTAEYAISLRKMAQGTGAALFATREILQIAFKELNLEKVYLNVLCDNTRAVSFYKKAGAVYEGTFAKHIKIKGQRKDLAWYCWFKEDNR